GPEVQVRLNEKHARADPLKRDDAPAAALTAVETDVIASETGCKAGGHQKLGVESRDLEPQRARALVPIKWEVAVDFLHRRRAVADRAAAGRLPTAATATLCRRRGRGKVVFDRRRRHHHGGQQGSRGDRKCSYHMYLAKGRFYDRHRKASVSDWEVR